MERKERDSGKEVAREREKIERNGESYRYIFTYKRTHVHTYIHTYIHKDRHRGRAR